MPAEKLDDPIFDKCFESVAKNCENYLAQAISIDNEQFRKILEIESSSERNKKAGEHINKTVEIAVDNAQKEINRDLSAAVEKMIQGKSLQYGQAGL